MEGNSSNYYLALACWADMNGFSGVADFMYKQSDEERFHMLKLMKYVIERDGGAKVPAYDEPTGERKNSYWCFPRFIQA